MWPTFPWRLRTKRSGEGGDYDENDGTNPGEDDELALRYLRNRRAPPPLNEDTVEAEEKEAAGKNKGPAGTPERGSKALYTDLSNKSLSVILILPNEEVCYGGRKLVMGKDSEFLLYFFFLLIAHLG